jgi:hypothetical protein
MDQTTKFFQIPGWWWALSGDLYIGFDKIICNEWTVASFDGQKTDIEDLIISSFSLARNS